MNRKFELCDTYPSMVCQTVAQGNDFLVAVGVFCDLIPYSFQFAVPAACTDELIRGVAQFRSKSRIPVSLVTTESAPHPYTYSLPSYFLGSTL